MTLMKDFLLEMLKKDAYRKGEFTLSSGKTSEHYVNCKPVILNGKGLFYASFVLLGLIDRDIKTVAGLTLGADPLVSGVALAGSMDEREINALIIRKEPKGHGTESQIEGPLPPKGSEIVVLEDVTTTGGSSLKAVNVLRDLGYTVNKVLSIVDRQEGAIDLMKKEGIELISVYTIEDFNGTD